MSLVPEGAHIELYNNLVFLVFLLTIVEEFCSLFNFPPFTYSKHKVSEIMVLNKCMYTLELLVFNYTMMEHVKPLMKNLSALAHNSGNKQILASTLISGRQFANRIFGGMTSVIEIQELV